MKNALLLFVTFAAAANAAVVVPMPEPAMVSEILGLGLCLGLVALGHKRTSKQ